jgi:hypothetical protein
MHACLRGRHQCEVLSSYVCLAAIYRRTTTQQFQAFSGVFLAVCGQQVASFCFPPRATCTMHAHTLTHSDTEVSSSTATHSSYLYSVQASQQTPPCILLQVKVVKQQAANIKNKHYVRTLYMHGCCMLASSRSMHACSVCN